MTHFAWPSSLGDLADKALGTGGHPCATSKSPGPASWVFRADSREVAQVPQTPAGVSCESLFSLHPRGPAAKAHTFWSLPAPRPHVGLPGMLGSYGLHTPLPLSSGSSRTISTNRHTHLNPHSTCFLTNLVIPSPSGEHLKLYRTANKDRTPWRQSP